MKQLLSLFAVLSAIVIVACLGWSFIVSLVTFGGALAGGATIGGAFSAVGMVLWVLLKIVAGAWLTLLASCAGYLYFPKLGAK